MHDLIQGGARQENGTDQKVIASPEDEFENRRLKAYCPETILRFVGGAGASFAGMATVVLAALVLAMGEFSFDEMAHLMSRAVVLCRRQKIRKLLIISTGVPGFHPSGISERYNLAERIASDAASMVKIAHVASAEWVRSGKFDIMVAKNRGLEAENFPAESAALEWLLQPEKNKCSGSTSASPRINPI